MGESVKMRYPAAVLLFIRRYQNTEPPGQYPEFSGSKIALSVFLKVAKAPFPHLEWAKGDLIRPHPEIMG